MISSYDALRECHNAEERERQGCSSYIFVNTLAEEKERKVSYYTELRLNIYMHSCISEGIEVSTI